MNKSDDIKITGDDDRKAKTNKTKSIKDIMSSTGSDELLKLDNQLCFALYVCSKEIIKKYKPLLDPLGLTYTGYIAMMALWEKDNVTVKELGERLFLDSGTLTPLLKKLEASGFIARERSSSDERNVFVHLTDSGKKLKEKAKEVPTALICSSGLKLEDPVSLIKTLHSVEKDLTGDGL